MKFKLYTPDASGVSEKEIAGWPELEGSKGLQALRQYILSVRNNQRQGNACTKTRAEVSGTGKKPFRQKGSGTSRQGSRRTVIWYKGGVVFGPRPRDFSQKINKKVKQLAFQRALFDRAADGKVDLISRFENPVVKTASFSAVLQKIAPKGKVLLVDDSFDRNTVLSARNIERVELVDPLTLNALDLLNHQNIIITESGADTLIARLNGGLS